MHIIKQNPLWNTLSPILIIHIALLKVCSLSITMTCVDDGNDLTSSLSTKLSQLIGHSIPFPIYVHHLDLVVIFHQPSDFINYDFNRPVSLTLSLSSLSDKCRVLLNGQFIDSPSSSNSQPPQECQLRPPYYPCCYQGHLLVEDVRVCMFFKMKARKDPWTQRTIIEK